MHQVVFRWPIFVGSDVWWSADWTDADYCWVIVSVDVPLPWFSQVMVPCWNSLIQPP